MTLTPPERDESVGFEVTVYENDSVVHTARFDTLEEADAFAEGWAESVPGARCEIEDRSHDHSTWETIESETAIDQSYPPGFPEG